MSSEDSTYKKATTPVVLVAVKDNDVDAGVPTDSGEDEDGKTGRGPRAGVPPATVEDPTTKSDSAADRRSDQGSARTDSGRTRTPAGAGAVDLDGGTKQDDVRTGRRLGGEIVAAKEEEESKRRNPFTKALDWLKNNWKTWAPILVLGGIVTGTAAWMLRGDPIKAAQRAARAGSAAGAGGAAKAGGKRLRVRGRKKKDDDDEDEDDAASGATPRGTK